MSRIKVWDYDDGIVVWGTHNFFEATAKIDFWLAEVGLSRDEIIDMDFQPDDFNSYWGSRKLLDMEDWPEHLSSEKWRPFRVPYMVYGY